MSSLKDLVGGADLDGNTSGYQFVSDRFNNSNSAIYFKSGYLNVPSGVYFSGDFTITVWIKLISLGPTDIIYFGSGAEIDNVMLYLRESGDKLHLIGVVWARKSSGQWYSMSFIQKELDIVANKWFHVAYVVQGTTGKFYIDGVEILSAPILSPSAKRRTRNYIGKTNWYKQNHDAVYDDIKIYKGAMSSSEVMEEAADGKKKKFKSIIYFVYKKKYFFYLITIQTNQMLLLLLLLLVINLYFLIYSCASPILWLDF